MTSIAALLTPEFTLRLAKGRAGTEALIFGTIIPKKTVLGPGLGIFGSSVFSLTLLAGLFQVP
jgi:hypothetical protein